MFESGKEQEEGLSLKCKRTNKTEVEGKCSSKIFDHSWFFTHLSQAYSRIYFLDFIDASVISKQLVKTFCFSRQKKYGYLYHACSGCLMFTSLQHLFENGWIFPPKDLIKENTGAQNTHAPFFFFSRCDIFFLQSNKSYFVLSGLLFICSINKLNLFCDLLFSIYCFKQSNSTYKDNNWFSFQHVYSTQNILIG